MRNRRAEDTLKTNTPDELMEEEAGPMLHRDHTTSRVLEQLVTETALQDNHYPLKITHVRRRVREIERRRNTRRAERSTNRRTTAT